MRLYEIDCKIAECFDEETGEIFNEELLNSLEMERAEKLTNIIRFIKNLKADAKALKEEEDSFKKRRTAAENKYKSLTEWLEKYLQGETFESEDKTAKVSYRNNPSVYVSDISLLPEEFIRRADPEPRKDDIKAAIKEGRTVPGAEIVYTKSMQVR